MLNASRAVYVSGASLFETTAAVVVCFTRDVYYTEWLAVSSWDESRAFNNVEEFKWSPNVLDLRHLARGSSYTHPHT